MINSINNLSFRGMTPYQIKKFAPTIADRNAVDFSRLLDIQMHSRDVLEVAGKNEIHHLMKLGDDYTIMGIFKYDGPDEEQPRVNFIGEIAAKIAERIDY